MINNTLYDFINLHQGEENKDKVLENIKSNISFRGSSLWILACAIVIASVGLNVNSTAVIIGAMLISPLMGPIVGAGFALAIYDFSLLKKSGKNLLIATIVSLFVSAIYFLISPFKETQTELLARTSPNIYDVMIAFFGGLVGVIALTRVEKGNPIPGVAIATALMPPLCTAGYGLAIGNWKYFLGAIFLYSINCVFICIATFSIVKYLKYPAFKQVDKKLQKQVQYGITAIVFLMLLPSIFFAFSLYKEQEFKQTATHFIEKEFIENGNTIIYKKINYNRVSSTIELAFLQKTYSENELNNLNEKAKQFGLKNTSIIIKKNISNNIQALKNDILNQVNKSENYQNEKDIRIAQLEQKIASNTFDNRQLFSEIKVLFPSIASISLSKQNITTTDTTYIIPILVYKANPKLMINDREKLKTWIQQKYNFEKIELIELN